MADLTPKETVSALQALIEYFGGIPEEDKVEFWTMLGLKLSKIVNQNPPWSWRYPKSVYEGSLQASRKFKTAILALGAAIDEVPSTMVLYSVQVKVYARPEAIQEGSIVMGESKPCERPGCPVRIVPSVPWRKYCSDECYKMDRKRKK